MALSRRQKLTLISLLFYWPSLFILSHIPIPLFVRRAGVSDKTLHILAYLILVFLLWFAVSPDRKVNWRRAAVWWILFVVVWYGVFDEWLQAHVGRSGDVADFLADLAGTVAGLILLSFFTFWPALLVVTGTTIFLLTNLTRVNPAELLPITNAAFHLFAYGFFTMLWIQHIHQFMSLKAPQAKWLIVTFALPTGLLLVVKLYSVISGRYFGIGDVVLSAIGIAAVVVTFFLMVVFRRRFAQRLSSSDA